MQLCEENVYFAEFVLSHFCSISFIIALSAEWPALRERPKKQKFMNLLIKRSLIFHACVNLEALKNLVQCNSEANDKCTIISNKEEGGTEINPVMAVEKKKQMGFCF